MVTIGKSHQINFLRGLFAIFVAFGHLYDIAKTNSDFHFLFMENFRPYLGTNWVIGFVVISGFLIENSVSNLIRKGGDVKKYAISRFTRIAPLYYVGLIIAIAIEIFGNYFLPELRTTYWTNTSMQAVLGQVLFLQGVNPGFSAYASFAATSTVAFEVWYYAIWALRIKFLRASSLSILFLVFILLYNYFVGVKLFRPILTRDFFSFWTYWLLGAYAFHYQDKLLAMKPVRFLADHSYYLLVAIFLPYSFIPADRISPYYFYFAVVFALILLKDESKGKWKNVNLTNFLGDLSYPLFLIHGPVGILSAWILNYYSVTDFITRYIVMLVGSFIVSTILTFYFERPLMQWRKKF